jgi:hypothetical protein
MELTTCRTADATARMTTDGDATARGGDATTTLLLGEASRNGRQTSREGGSPVIG